MTHAYLPPTYALVRPTPEPPLPDSLERAVSKVGMDAPFIGSVRLTLIAGAA